MASLALSNRQSGAPQEYVTKPRPFDRPIPASHETAFGQYVHNVKNAPTVLEGVNEGVNNLAETVYKSLGGLFGRRK